MKTRPLKTVRRREAPASVLDEALSTARPRGAGRRGLAWPVSAAFAQNVVVHGNRRVDTETIRSYFTGTGPASIEGRRRNCSRPVCSPTSASAARRHDRRQRGGKQRHQPRRLRGQQQGQDREALQGEIQTQPRGPFEPGDRRCRRAAHPAKSTAARAAAARASQSRIVDLPNGRIDVVFTIDEGGKTGVKEIRFVGNSGLVQLSAARSHDDDGDEPSSFFKTSDVYDPDKIAADLELIRRYYLKNGYADFRIVIPMRRYRSGAAAATSSPSRSKRARNTASRTMRVDSRIADIAPSVLRPQHRDFGRRHLQRRSRRKDRRAA